MLDEIKLFSNLKNIQNISESETGTINIKSDLDHQIQKQGIKIFGWQNDKINSMTI